MHHRLSSRCGLYGTTLSDSGQGLPVIANYSSQPGVELTYFTSGGTGEG
jgi:hypothetical protein